MIFSGGLAYAVQDTGGSGVVGPSCHIHGASERASERRSERADAAATAVGCGDSCGVSLA